LAASINHCLKISLQVRPAYLPSPRRQPVVRPEPISADDAFSLLAYHLFGMLGCSTFQQMVDRHIPGSIHPQPFMLLRFGPACLIHILRKLTAGIQLRLLDDRLKRLAYSVLQG